MDYYIYLTTNLINGKKYIGQHKGKINDSYVGSGTLIKKAIEKYGIENFSKEILYICKDRQEADEKEKFYIAYYDAVNDPDFYNLQEGGTQGDGWRACHRWMQNHPEEAKQVYKENSERLKQWAKDHPEEYKEKVIKPFVEGAKEYWKNHPEEQKALMQKVNQKKEEWQKNHPEEHKKQVDAWRKAGSDTNSQKVCCLTTGEIFPSQCEAARHYGIVQANISKCLKGERKSAGKHPITKEKLRWQLVEK